jgi:hypothetical protein
MNIKDSIVAILNSKGKIVGTGFVAGENLILTCAHVIEQVTARWIWRSLRILPRFGGPKWVGY